MHKSIHIALAGNPNAGKTTVFNGLTGAHQHVGNYPGITVEQKVGTAYHNDIPVHITDLPGTYSLTAYTLEEVVTRSVLADDRPDVVIDVINASALERNLYLTVQLLEMGAPVVLALNMIDEARAMGLYIDTPELSRRLHMPVVETVARRKEGMTELLEACVEDARRRLKAARKARRHASGMLSTPDPDSGSGTDVDAARREERKKHRKHHDDEHHGHHHGGRHGRHGHEDMPAGERPVQAHSPSAPKDRQPYDLWDEPLRISYGPDLDPVLQSMETRIKNARLLTDRYAARWVALKFLENDSEIRSQCRLADLELTRELESMTEEVSRHLKDTLGTYPEAVVADYRYGFIASVLRDGVITRARDTAGRLALSDKLDAVLTQRLLGPLILLGVLLTVYEVTFVLGAYPMRAVEMGFDLLKSGVEVLIPDGMLRSLLVSGLIDGVGGVMSFVPLIMLIFLQIAFLEDSGYMARMAYMLDRIFRFFGLHGCSVMPFIVGGGIAGGCAVPGVLAARTLRSPREKLATLLTVPFMACGAKLPVFILFVGVFFPGREAQIMFLLTMAGWVTALLVARVLRSTIIRGAATPFVMELPPYRLPTWRGLLIHTWERTWEYLKKAGTVILAISILLWAAMTFPRLDERLPHADAAAQAQAQLEHSFAGRLGLALEPYTRYAGFDWRTDIALIGGFAAKEVIVATLGTAYSLGDAREDTGRLASQIADDPTWNKGSALALMLFVLLYAPCMVTVAAIRQETGSTGWAVFSMVFNTAVAFGVAVGVYQLSRAL